MSIWKTVGKVAKVVNTASDVIGTFENLNSKSSHSSGSRKDLEFDCNKNFGGSDSDGTSKAICELVQALLKK